MRNGLVEHGSDAHREDPDHKEATRGREKARSDLNPSFAGREHSREGDVLSDSICEARPDDAKPSDADGTDDAVGLEGTQARDGEVTLLLRGRAEDDMSLGQRLRLDRIELDSS